MPFYLFQWRYKDPAIQAMVDVAQDRPTEVRKVVGAFGGRLHSFFFAFGEYDGVGIVEFPDNESCAACSLVLSGAGGNARLKTTVLLTADEAEESMRLARSASHGYRSPVGYASHG